MVTIYQNGKKIEYTQGDTFAISISPEDGDVFLAGSTIDFIVADESSKTPKIENTYPLTDGFFNISLTGKDREIPYGNYVYKIILRTTSGQVITQKNGEFVVKWEA